MRLDQALDLRHLGQSALYAKYNGETVWQPQGGGEPETYAELLTTLGAARYWDLSEPTGNFQPVIGSDEFAVDASGLARAQDGPFVDDHTMTITGGNHRVPKAELGTTVWTWAVWLFGGGATTSRAIVGGGSSVRFWYLLGLRLRPYGFSWNAQQGPALSEERWYLMVVGSDAGGVTYWLDGVEAYTHATPVATSTHATDARWGTNASGTGTEAFAHPMAHPATWDRKLTGAEVAQLWDDSQPLMGA